MSAPPTSQTGRELYALLSAVYRDRDNGDLAGYLDAFGALLDRLRATLDQRLADCFPESGEGEREAQSWLLPYFADLLDVRLLSPYLPGRRKELGDAIAWRQRKGTLRILEQIAEVVGQIEVDVQEGWKRVATTPAAGFTLLPAAAFGETEPDPRNPLAAARRPGLPVATVDLRLPSRAVQAPPEHPLARTTRFSGKEVAWRQLHPAGVPCFPGSFEDASRRIVDLRTPSFRHGHAHPRRLLLFLPPPAGFFPLDQVRLKWKERDDAAHKDRHITDLRNDPRLRRIFNPSRRSGAKEAFTATVTDDPDNFGEAMIEVEDLNFLGALKVTQGRLVLRRVATQRVEVGTTDAKTPVLDAADCLFDDIDAPNGLVRLEHCTVRGTLTCRRLLASDCIFAGAVVVKGARADSPGCIRFSRLPRVFRPNRPVPLHATTEDAPVFFEIDFCDSAHAPRRATKFGDPGYGCLHPATPDSICFGAEDGGEMGADHHRALCLARAAVAAKLEEFLPMGLEAVLIPDARLLVPPPQSVRAQRARKPRS